jgi:hypothetical protein
MRKEDLRSKDFLRLWAAVILSLALLASAMEGKERKGAQLIITKKDGKVLQGELLAVKGQDLILLDNSTSGEVTAGLVDIQAIKVVKKSQWFTGMLVGAVVGIVAGVLSGKSSQNQDPNDDWTLTKGQGAVAGAIGYGFLGAAVGAGMGSEDIVIKKTDANYLAKMGSKLRGMARDRS